MSLYDVAEITLILAASFAVALAITTLILIGLDSVENFLKKK